LVRKIRSKNQHFPVRAIFAGVIAARALIGRCMVVASNLAAAVVVIIEVVVEVAAIAHH